MTRTPTRMSAADVAFYGVFCAVCLVLGYLELLFPLPMAVPGVKLGLGNIVVLYVLYARGVRPAGIMMLFKVGASSIFFGNPAALPFALAGGVVSFVCMAALSRIPFMGVLSVSCLGGITHNLGQLAVVYLVLGPLVALANLPLLCVVGAITGAIIGMAVSYILRALKV